MEGLDDQTDSLPHDQDQNPMEALHHVLIRTMSKNLPIPWKDSATVMQGSHVHDPHAEFSSMHRTQVA